jgi:hypothetical protein
MAVAILVIASPLLPANAASDCDHMSMSSMPMAMDKAMDMKAPLQKAPKPDLPCNDGMSCFGSAGCCAPAIDQASLVSLPKMEIADAHWTSQLAGPDVARKPALPPPIV